MRRKKNRCLTLHGSDAPGQRNKTAILWAGGPYALDGEWGNNLLTLNPSNATKFVAHVLYLQLGKKNSKASDKNEPVKSFKGCYQAKYLLTRNEWYEYKKLKKYAAEMDLQVCPKVRLLDIIEPRKDAENYRGLLSRVQSKHIDFLICDTDLHIKAILELDDHSHDRADRQDRDAFIDEILTDIGYTVIRTHSIADNTLSVLKNDNKTVTK